MNDDRLSQLQLEEAELQFPSFNHQVAWDLGIALRNNALNQNAPVAIEVYAFEQVLFQCALPGSVADNLDWIKRKRNTVLRYGQSSFYIGQKHVAKGTSLLVQSHIEAKEYADHGGAFPIRLDNSGLIGAVTVSGLPQLDDHNMVVNVLRQYLGRNAVN